MSVQTLPATPMTPLPRANAAPLRPLPDPYVDGDSDRLFEVGRGKRADKNMGLMQTYIAGILYRILASHCEQSTTRPLKSRESPRVLRRRRAASVADLLEPRTVADLRLSHDDPRTHERGRTRGRSRGAGIRRPDRETIPARGTTSMRARVAITAHFSKTILPATTSVE